MYENPGLGERIGRNRQEWRETFFATPGGAFVSADVVAVSTEVTKGDFRPWQEKWRMMTCALRKLEAAYAGSAPIDPIEVELRADSFFDECSHLWDWLCENSAQGVLAIPQGDITSYRDASPDLTLAQDICNTNKHHTRRAGFRTARIRSVEMGPFGNRVSVEAGWGLPTATTEDGLGLACRCVAAWTKLLGDNGIVLPT